MKTLMTGLAAGALLISSPAAQATVTPGSVTVDRNVKQSSDLQLLGVSDTGVIASRDGSGVVAGALASAPNAFGDPWLAGYGAAYHPPADGSRVSDLIGSIIRWAEPKGPAWVVHRQGAFDGGGQKDFDSPDQSHSRVGLITFTKVGIDVVADHDDTQLNGEVPTAISLTPNSVVWFAEYQPVNILGVVHRRARAGGAMTTVAAPQAARTGEELAATDTTIAVTRRQRYRTDVGETSVRLYALRGPSTTWPAITLPGQDDRTGTPFGPAFGGLRSNADTIAFALGGDDLTIAGVYRVDGDATPALSARVVPENAVSDVSLSAGRLTYAVASGLAVRYNLRRATVSTSGTLTTGAPAYFAPGLTLAHSREPGVQTSALSVSGDRLAARSEDGPYANRELDTRLLTDSGTYLAHLTEKPPIEAAIKNSGDYLLMNHKVYRSDSLTPVLDLTSRKCRGEDLFGSLVVCNQPDGKNSVVDVTGRFPAGTTSGTGTGPVAIWGTTVAWLSNPTQISIQDLGVAGSLKTVAVSGPVRDLRLSEGVIGWTDEDGDLMVADRADLAVQPTGLRAPGSVDDHLVAGISGNTLQVSTLPSSTKKYRPRLIDAVAPGSFDGSVLPWRPLFHTTKPLVNVKVTIKQGAATIATLIGTGAVGTVRDVRWTGKTAAGTYAPAGTYTWTLTADAKDGDGSLTNVDGTSVISGSVNLTYS